MRKDLAKTLCCAAAAALPLCCPAPARAGELAAIVSSEAGPYAEAYAAFRAGLSAPADFYDASSPGFSLPEEARYVAVFGARATALDFPEGTHRVYALAPVAGRGHRWHQISMLPPPAEALAAYSGLQPGLKRLAVFWAAYPGEKYMEELREAGEAAGIEIISARLKSPDSLPERLRRLMGKMDAFWLMPDPVLITQGSLMVLANFSCANAVPFYAPTYALVQNGATASFAPDFAAAGAAAAWAVEELRAGRRVRLVIYPQNTRLRLNQQLLDKCRWPLKVK
ncbi:MAG: ABC transporter substrate binding protein [Elusimicrobiales bacterium]|nr:ABC transporter substrate binding protein [Elusimicrobiales bacterium]